MRGIQINSSTTLPVRETFREYARHNRRDTEFLWQDTSRKLATDLFVETDKAITPTKAEIAADVKKLGWKIPAFFKDGRIGRGTREMWEGLAYSKAAKSVKRGRRGRRTRGEQILIDRKVSRRNRLKMMQDFVIGLRNKARKYLASGWLGAIVDLGGSPKLSSGAVDSDRGGAVVRRGNGLVEVEMWNRTPGIETMNAKANFVGRAIARRVADMMLYIERKRAEAAQIFSRRAA